MARKKTRRQAAHGRKLAEAQSPFDDAGFCRWVIEAVTGAGRTVRDQQAFLRRLRHFEYGLSAEVECAAVLAWLGNCVLIHPLGQEAYVHSDLGEVQVPDLLAVFSRNGQTLPLLIEVKSTNKLYVPWSDQYRAKLTRYGELVGLPVLLAWRPRTFGRWLLVDATSDQVVTDGRIQIGQAVMHNLMSIVAGDCLVHPTPGVGLNLQGRIIGKKTPQPRGYSASMEIERAFIGTREEELKGLSGSTIALIIAAASVQYFEESKGTVSWGHVTPGGTADAPEEGAGFVFLQDILRMLVGWSKKEGQRIAWRHVLLGLESVKPKRQMVKELRQDIGKAVRYIFFQMPKNLPAFVPTSWGEMLPKSRRKSR